MHGRPAGKAVSTEIGRPQPVGPARSAGACGRARAAVSAHQSERRQTADRPAARGDGGGGGAGQ
eukprot:353961-Chlamydomonas_euryale.AAC.3